MTNPTARNSTTSGAAFTLVELLVVIAIVGTLLSLTLPALRGARSSAKELNCLSNLKGLGTTVEIYLQTYASRYPFAPAGTDLLVSPPGVPPAYLTSGSHWNLRSSWPALFHDVAPWREHFRAWVCPGAGRDPGEPWQGSVPGFVGASYSYCQGFFARPEVWVSGTVPDPRLLAPVGASDLVHPSGKAIFYDTEMGHAPIGARNLDARPVLLGDGHAATRKLSEATPPARNPFTELSLPLHDTPSGVRGLDY